MKRILILTALEKELKPVLKALASPFKSPVQEIVGGRIYYVYECSSELSIICSSFMGMGQLNSALAVSDALNNYKVDKVILTGICGGLDSELNYGDIIISDQIVDYELGKIKSEEEQIRWSVYRSDFELVQRMGQFKSKRWVNYLKEVFPDKSLLEPSVNVGIVLSGNKVIADHRKVEEFKKVWRKALAVEMEASGVAAVLWQMKNPPSYIMVKSICDFADKQKNDDWQEYAAYASASFVLDFIFNNESFLSKESKREGIAPTDQMNKLFCAIKGTYNLSELNVLAFSIGVDIEDINGSGKSEKIVELIKYCQRKHLLNKLIERVNEERDNLLLDYN